MRQAEESITLKRNVIICPMQETQKKNILKTLDEEIRKCCTITYRQPKLEQLIPIMKEHFEGIDLSNVSLSLIICRIRRN